MKNARILLLINNVHMGLGHLGLAALARKFKKDPMKLEPGELLMFINTARDKLKVYGHGNVIGYLKMPGGRKIDLNAIQYIPRAFQANNRIDYDLALKESLTRALQKETMKNPSPLMVYQNAKAAGVMQ